MPTRITNNVNKSEDKLKTEPFQPTTVRVLDAVDGRLQNQVGKL